MINLGKFADLVDAALAEQRSRRDETARTPDPQAMIHQGRVDALEAVQAAIMGGQTGTLLLRQLAAQGERHGMETEDAPGAGNQRGEAGEPGSEETAPTAAAQPGAESVDRCERRISGGGPGDTCFRKATVEFRGRKFCKWHDPRKPSRFAK